MEHEQETRNSEQFVKFLNIENCMFLSTDVSPELKKKVVHLGYTGPAERATETAAETAAERVTERG